METIRPYAKAVVASGVAFFGTLGTAVTDGAVSPGEWCVVAVATLTAAGTVFGVRNAASPQ